MKQILIVDDSTFQRKIVQKILSAAGFQTEQASNGQECLQALERERFELVLLDLNMPEMDGFQVLESMSDKEHAVPVIVLTADIQNSTRQRCIDLGAENVLNKPPKQEELLQEIERLF